MSIIATDKSTPRELIPAGNYVARCYQMIEIGTVTDIVMGKSVTAKKVRIGWELPTELKIFKKENGEQPLVISKEYTQSMNSKATLRKILASWRGKDFTEAEAKAFDVTKLIGVPCFLNIIHKQGVSDPTKSYEIIAGITPLPKGVKCPAAINPKFILSYDSWDKEMFLTLPDFIQDKMKSSEEFQKILRPAETHLDANQITEPVDDLPL